MQNKLIKPIFTLTSLLLVQSALGTNGYNSHGIGTKNKAMAGAGIALPEQAISLANNPASLTETGDAFDVSASLFSPILNYKTTASQENGNFGAFTIGSDEQKSTRNYFIIPTVAKSWKIDDDSAWGMAFYGRGGMNTKWTGGVRQLSILMALVLLAQQHFLV
ncbi:MAG: outer membrane protein transport protein, partial [Proteobacteria bacterium]|nr:outer membrane protein transport protein [Pseudomonadota bacterium]